MSLSPSMAELAETFWKKGFYCAESVVLAAAGKYGIEAEGIPAMATGFCSGLSRTSGYCGAVTGGIMAIGLIRGRTSSSDPVDPCYSAVQTFLHDFEAAHGSLDCTPLLGCDLSTPEGQAAYSRRFGTGENPVCCGFTVAAARLVETILS